MSERIVITNNESSYIVENIGIIGQEFIVVNSDSGSITIATTSSQTINGTSTATLNQWDRITVVSDGANWIRIA